MAGLGQPLMSFDSIMLEHNLSNALNISMKRMQERGYSPSVIEMFRRIVASQMSAGKKPRDAIKIAVDMVKTTSPRNMPIGK